MPRSGLDTARVVEEAAQVADAEGLGAVTLACVAARLGVRAPSLYNHVQGRPGLLRELTLRSLDELADILRDAAVGRSGAEALVAIARAYRAYARSHPGRYAATIRAPTAQQPAGEDGELAAAAERGIGVLVAVLGAWDVTGDAALHQVRVVRSALHGFISIEAEGGFGLALSLDDSFDVLLHTLIAGLGAPSER